MALAWAAVNQFLLKQASLSALSATLESWIIEWNVKVFLSLTSRTINTMKQLSNIKKRSQVLITTRFIHSLFVTSLRLDRWCHADNGDEVMTCHTMTLRDITDDMMTPDDRDTDTPPPQR